MATENKSFKSVMQMAFSDMSADLREMYGYQTHDRYTFETWYVTPTSLNNKETRRLNRLLGLANINHGKK